MAGLVLCYTHRRGRRRRWKCGRRNTRKRRGGRNGARISTSSIQQTTRTTSEHHKTPQHQEHQDTSDEEFLLIERWTQRQEYFATFTQSQFNPASITRQRIDPSHFKTPLFIYDELDQEDSDNGLRGDGDGDGDGVMRGDGAVPDRRHNPNANNLKSLLKKNPRVQNKKKNRVIFNESRNEFFEADYIIVIREECAYDEESDEGVCTCNQHELVRVGTDGEAEPTLSPPEGYKDGLFNRDGTLKEGGLFARGPPGSSVALVSEGGGPVFTPHHLRQLQVIQRLQQEQLRRARLHADGACDSPVGEEVPELQECGTGGSANILVDPNILTAAKGSYAKEIVAGEERPKVSAAQQTTPTDENEHPIGDDREISRSLGRTSINDEEIGGDVSDTNGSPMRLGGILKGGRLWTTRPLQADIMKTENGQNQSESDDTGSQSNQASDDEGRSNSATRAVRFSETLPFRLGGHNSLRPNSALRQLFPQGAHPYLVTAESLKAFEEARRARLPSYQDEDQKPLGGGRDVQRRTLPKRTPPKNDTSLTERIKMLTCDIDDDIEPPEQEERGSPSGEESRVPQVPPAAQNIKNFSSSSSSSSASSCSSTSSAFKKVTDIFSKRQERIAECAEEGGVVIIPQVSSASDISHSDFSSEDINSVPAPDVLAGIPNTETEELARFAAAGAARTERLRRRYHPPSADNSDDDDHDDYGFQRRPSVRGIKPRFGSTNEILQQMQAQLQPPSQQQQQQQQQQQPQMQQQSQIPTRHAHVSWPYYSESNLSQSAHVDQFPNSRSSVEDFQQNLRLADCYDVHNHNVPPHHRHSQQDHVAYEETIYQNCSTYANIRCDSGERDLYGGGYSYLKPSRRPESPPPIRSYHQTMVLIPYSNLPHYSNTSEAGYHMQQGEQQNGTSGNFQQQQQQQQHYSQISGDSQTMLKIGQSPSQMVGMSYPQGGVPMQITCSAPVARIRSVPSRPVARHMICYSEKVAAPMYQPAPSSPGVAAVRGVPEGAPAPAASPTNPHPHGHSHLHQHPNNSVYYAMNV